MSLLTNWRAFGLGFLSLGLVALTACDDKDTTTGDSGATSTESDADTDADTDTDTDTDADTGLFFIGYDIGNSESYLADYGLGDTATVLITPESWNGPIRWWGASNSTYYYLCMYGYQTTGVPAAGCQACDWAYEVTLTNTWSYFDRCDALEAYGITPDLFEGSSFYGYQEGAENLWSYYKYPNTGLIWQDYGDGWSENPYVYNVVTPGGFEGDRVYMFAYFGPNYYYYQ